MLDEAELQVIARHGTFHQMGMCLCPCYEALLTVGRKIQVENGLRAELARVSPDLLAALTLGAPDEGEPDAG